MKNVVGNTLKKLMGTKKPEAGKIDITKTEGI